MWILALGLWVSLGTLGDKELARRAELERDPSIGCWEVASGRRTTPIRENYLTYSDVVGTVKRGEVFFGQRVQGENKVLVMTPTAADWIGIARFTFLKEVPKERCASGSLLAPAYEELLSWVTPLPGVAAWPRLDNTLPLHVGCYLGLRGATLIDPDGGRQSLAGELFWAGDPLDQGRVSTKLEVLTPSGERRGKVSRSSLERMPLSRCAGPR